MPDQLKIVHLPVYHDNAYQKLLMDEQRKLGHEVIDGGGGGNFLRTCLFKWKPDILHLHWPHPYMIKSSLIGSWLRSSRLIMELKIIQMAGIKLVWTIHNLVSHDSKNPHLELYFLKIIANTVNAIIVHGKAAKNIVIKQLQINNPDKIIIIPHGNYIGYYPDNATREQARGVLGIQPESFVLLFIGQIHPYKGVQDLISAFKRLKSHRLVLVIAGTIPSLNYHEVLKTMIADDPRINFYPGYIDDNKLQYYFHASDLVVFPFRDIFTSGSLILAMGFGGCCLVPDFDVVTETIDPETGIVFNSKNTSSLQTKMENIIKNPADIYEKGIKARRRVENWTFAEMAYNTIQVYLL